ncbi:MAG TPA: MBL fold metallo-hydrolase [Jatrophihabitans sp.]|nr:MBL fold metallo-hydrolase [Jatrophihabitans sp.]
MELTKHGHSCVRIDDGDRTLVLDPGGFSDLDAALDGADAVLITHEHRDHLDADRVRAAAKADARLSIWAPKPVAEQLADLGEQVVTVGAGEAFEAAGFTVRTFGGQHALIHPLIPIVANVGYLINDTVYHPGDSLVVPDAHVQTLLLPAVAPWSKVSEVIDYVVAVRAPRAYPIHDAIVADIYHGLLQGTLVPIAARYGVDYRGWDGPVSA